MVNSHLGRALATLLPQFDTPDIPWLRCCLTEGERLQQAWATLRRTPLKEVLRSEPGELKRLAPLFAENLRRNGIAPDGDLQTILRTTSFREELRAGTYQRALREILDILGARGLQVLVIRGAALGEVYYGHPALRHSHDIDLLIRPEDCDQAVRELARRGLSAPNPLPPIPELVHPTGLPVRLHGTLYETEATRPLWEGWRERSRKVTLAGVTARVLSPEDNLAQVLAKASCDPSRANLQWACDAWKIAAQAPDLDPDRLLRCLKESGLLLSATVLLGFLIELGAPIAPSLSRNLGAAWDSATSLDRDLALFGLRSSTRGGLSAVLRRIPDLNTRAAVLYWVLFPGVQYIQWAHRPRRRYLIPAYYLLRVLQSIRGPRRLYPLVGERSFPSYASTPRRPAR